MKRNVYTSFAIAACLLMTACNITDYWGTKGDSSTPRPSIGEPFKIRISESVGVDATELLISFVEVIGDSRCAEGVVCFWEGEAEIRLKVTHGEDGTLEINLKIPGLVNTPYEKGKTRRAFGYQFSLLDLLPYPRHEHETNPRSYTALIRVDDDTQ